MQNAETVLDVLRERGRKGLPCEELYRQMFNKELYLKAYGRIYANHGAMTPGATSEGCVFLKIVNLRLSPHESSDCGSVRMFRDVPGIT